MVNSKESSREHKVAFGLLDQCVHVATRAVSWTRSTGASHCSPREPQLFYEQGMELDTDHGARIVQLFTRAVDESGDRWKGRTASGVTGVQRA